MAEIVGTIAAIVGIAGACVGLGQNLADCVGTMSYAVDDIEIIVLEVNIFSGLLMSFTKVMKKLNGDQRMDSAMVQAMVQITPLIRLIRRQSKLIKRRLEKFLEKLQSLNLVRDYSMIQRSVGRFWWYFKKSEFVFLKTFLDAAKSNMQLIILLVLLAKNLDHDENKPKDEPKDKAELEDQELERVEKQVNFATGCCTRAERKFEMQNLVNRKERDTMRNLHSGLIKTKRGLQRSMSQRAILREVAMLGSTRQYTVETSG